MWLRRELLFWSRLVHYHVSQTTVGHAFGATALKPRLVGQMALLALVVVGGYLVGRFSAPGCAPVVSAGCVEAQAPSPPSPPAPIETVSERQAIVVLGTPAPPPMSHFHTAAATPPPSAADLIPPLPEKKAAERVAILTNDEVREMQAWLKAFGFDPGPIDGYPGTRTKAAIKRYQAARQTEETGQLDRSLLRKVRREAGHT